MPCLQLEVSQEKVLQAQPQRGQPACHASKEEGSVAFLPELCVGVQEERELPHV